MSYIRTIFCYYRKFTDFIQLLKEKVHHDITHAVRSMASQVASSSIEDRVLVFR